MLLDPSKLSAILNALPYNDFSKNIRCAKEKQTWVASLIFLVVESLKQGAQGGFLPKENDQVDTALQ